jgi:MerR HTH family regulatory protein
MPLNEARIRPIHAVMPPIFARRRPDHADVALAGTRRPPETARPMPKYTRAQLSKASGEPESVIEHWIKRGLVPWAPGSGSQRHYTEEHLHRVLAVRALRDQGVRAGDLARRIREATEDDLR